MTTPGLGFGRTADGYIRVALTVETPRLLEAVDRIGKLNLVSLWLEAAMANAARSAWDQPGGPQGHSRRGGRGPGRDAGRDCPRVSTYHETKPVGGPPARDRS